MRVCLLTTGQPSTNPRLVKEADALAGAGFEVRVVYAHWEDWAVRSDQVLLKTRKWSHERVGGDPGGQRVHYAFTRTRHKFSRIVCERSAGRIAPRTWTLSRVTPELVSAARRVKADLYIAHNLGALPAAVAGARDHGALAGFDAEDFHSDMVPPAERTVADDLAREVEARYLGCCAYVTTVCPGLADAYVARYGISRPVPILNVFPLDERPAEFRLTRENGPLRLYWFSQTIGRNRGLEDAVRAMGLAGTQNVELYLQGRWASGYRAELESLASSCGLERRQIVHLPPEDPGSLVRRASTFDVGLAVEQSRSVNQDLTASNKIFTYLLAGCAIAATDTKGQEPILREVAPGGSSYRARDVAALAGIFSGWLQDRGALDVARRASWDWGTRRYNWDLEKEKFLAVVDGVVSRQEVCV